MLSKATINQSYRIWLVFTHKNGDFGAISVTRRNCVAPIPKVTSDSCSCYTEFCPKGVIVGLVLKLMEGGGGGGDGNGVI